MFTKISDMEGGGVVGGQPDKGSHDRGAGSESKSTMIGSFCTRQLVRVSTVLVFSRATFAGLQRQKLARSTPVGRGLR